MLAVSAQENSPRADVRFSCRENGEIGVFLGKDSTKTSKMKDDFVPDCGCILGKEQFALIGGEAAKVQCIPLLDGGLQRAEACVTELGMDDVSCMASISGSDPPAAVVGDDSGDLFRVHVTRGAAGDYELHSAELPLPHTSGLASMVVMPSDDASSHLLVTASYDCAVQAQLLAPAGAEAAADSSAPEPKWTAKIEALPPLDITDASGRPLQSAGGIGSNPPFPHAAVALPGKRIAFGCGDGTVRILSAVDGRTLSICVGVHTAGIACLATSPASSDTLLLFSGGLDGRVAAWRIEADLHTADADEEQEEQAVDVLVSKDVAWMTRLPTDAATEQRWNANAVVVRLLPGQDESPKFEVSVAVAREQPESAGHLVIYTLSEYSG